MEPRHQYFKNLLILSVWNVKTLSTKSFLTSFTPTFFYLLLITTPSHSNKLNNLLAILSIDFVIKSALKHNWHHFTLNLPLLSSMTMPYTSQPNKRPTSSKLLDLCRRLSPQIWRSTAQIMIILGTKRNIESSKAWNQTSGIWFRQE